MTVQDEKLTYSGPKGEAPLIVKDLDSGRRLLQDTRGSRVSQLQDASRSALEFEVPDWEGNHLRFLLLETTYWLRLTARKGTASFARVSAVFETAAATSLDSP